MISSLVGVLPIWLAAVDRILRFQIEIYPEADRDSALVILGCLLKQLFLGSALLDAQSALSRPGRGIAPVRWWPHVGSGSNNGKALR
jgi:hypothetical protein